MTDYKAKMHQIRFRLGLRPIYPAGGAYSVPQTPSWIWGRFAAGGEDGLWNWRERGGEGEGGGSGGEGN